MDEAKEVHSALKLAAGIFLCAKEQQAQLPAQIEKATDLDIRVIESYLLQCQVSCNITFQYAYLLLQFFNKIFDLCIAFSPQSQNLSINFHMGCNYLLCYRLRLRR